MVVMLKLKYRTELKLQRQGLPSREPSSQPLQTQQCGVADCQGWCGRLLQGCLFDVVV